MPGRGGRLPGRGGRLLGRGGRPLRGWFRLPERWIRAPRRTVRLRLTAMYGALFLLLGAALLGITYLLVSEELPSTPGKAGPTTSMQSGSAMVFRVASGSCHLTAYPPAPPAQIQSQAQRCLTEQRAAELNQLLTKSGVALAIMTVVAIGLGWLVAGRMLGKLRTITTAARSVSASNLHARLALAGPDDELKELGDTFDGLLARLEGAFGAQR